jgi:hypothetical protein
MSPVSGIGNEVDEVERNRRLSRSAELHPPWEKTCKWAPSAGSSRCACAYDCGVGKIERQEVVARSLEPFLDGADEQNSRSRVCHLILAAADGDSLRR